MTSTVIETPTAKILAEMRREFPREANRILVVDRHRGGRLGAMIGLLLDSHNPVQLAEALLYGLFSVSIEWNTRDAGQTQVVRHQFIRPRPLDDQEYPEIPARERAYHGALWHEVHHAVVKARKLKPNAKRKVDKDNWMEAGAKAFDMAMTARRDIMDEGVTDLVAVIRKVERERVLDNVVRAKEEDTYTHYAPDAIRAMGEHLAARADKLATMPLETIFKASLEFADRHALDKGANDDPEGRKRLREECERITRELDGE